MLNSRNNLVVRVMACRSKRLRLKRLQAGETYDDLVCAAVRCSSGSSVIVATQRFAVATPLCTEHWEGFANGELELGKDSERKSA